MEKGYDLYLNMLQTERAKEVGFFSNSHLSIDLYEIRDILETKLNTKVRIRYKSIYRRKQMMKVEREKLIQAIHIELEMKGFRVNFNNLVAVHGRSVSGFEDGRKMRFFAYSDLVKSDMVRGVLTKACERQKFFLEAILQDYTSSFLYLDTVPEGCSLPTMREMLLSIKSTTFPSLPLFYSANRIWDRMRYRREYTVLYMPHVASEMELMLNNLLPYLHEYGEEVLMLFIEDAKKEAKDDKWDTEDNRVVCATDLYMEEEEEDERVFITNQKQLIKVVKKANIVHPPINKEQLAQAKKAAEEKLQAMLNRVEAAFYGENDSIATMEDEIDSSVASARRSVYSKAKSKNIASIITNNSNQDRRKKHPY